MWQKSGRMSQNTPQNVYMRIQLSGYHPSTQNTPTELFRCVGSADRRSCMPRPADLDIRTKKAEPEKSAPPF
ncbi:MAG: hypothetical protein CMO07_11835 [Thalassospira sp.]|nr:hypothetical protein [Thalassospira sp.]HAI28709.1 hypothetical protein [Thalassospira sp.]